MKILEIVLSLSNGGAERFVVDLSNEMSKSDDVTLLVLKDFKLENNGFYKNEVSDKVNLINLGFNNGFKFSYLIAIMKTIQIIDPDIVHFHDVADKYCLLPIIFHTSKTTFVQTIHNDINSLYKDIFHKFTIGLLGKLKHLSFATISDQNNKDFKVAYPNTLNKMIYNGRAQLKKSMDFDLVKNEISRMQPNESTLVIIHIARCAPQKNQELLINSFNNWIKSGANAILLVIGSGFESKSGEHLKSISCENIHFIGPKSNVADYLLCADAFALSSLFEGMPITVIESMSLGVPVLSTPVCGIVDTIEDNENGCISKDFTEDSYLEMLKRFGSNYTTLKNNCSQRQTNTFSIEFCAKSYLEYFKTLSH